MRIISLLATVIAALVMTISANAGTFKLHMCNAHQPAKAELVCAQHNIYHAAFTLLYVKHERSRTLQVVPVDATKLLQLARLKSDMTWLYTESKQDKAEAQRRIYLGSFPPHHALWMCIHGGEGNWDDPNSGSNGHYGGLQMTPGWLGYFSGTANHYTQLQQEWYAEQGYRDSGYSSSWLNGQWGQTIGPCWTYA